MNNKDTINDKVYGRNEKGKLPRGPFTNYKNNVSYTLSNDFGINENVCFSLFIYLFAF